VRQDQVPKAFCLPCCLLLYVPGPLIVGASSKMVKIEEWDDQWTYGLCSSHHLSHHHNNSKKRHNNIKLIATTMKILSIRTINREYYKMPTFSASNRHWDATVTPYSTFKMIIFNCTNHYRCINYKIASLKLHRFLWCKAIQSTDTILLHLYLCITYWWCMV